VQLVEIPVEARAPVLLGYVNQRAFTHSGAQSARHFFGLKSKPTLADMVALAEQYPVFEIRPRPDMASQGFSKVRKEKRTTPVIMGVSNPTR